MKTDEIEEEIRLLYLDDPNHKEEGIKKLFNHYQPLIINFLREKFPGIPIETVDEIYSEAILAIWNKLEIGDLCLKKSLKGLVFTIAYNKAVDYIRKITNRPETSIYEDDIIDSHLVIKDTNIQWEWNMFTDSDLQKIKEIILEYLNSLSGNKKLVGFAIIQFYPYEPKGKELIDFLKEEKQDVTTSQVYSIRKEILEKFYKIVLDMTK